MSASTGLHVRNAPSSRLVFTYLAGGLLSFLFLSVWSAISYPKLGGFYANPRYLAWVHVAVLGWINMIIFGVLFQFIPVVLNVKLGSEKLAWWQLVFYVPGAAGMAFCFWIGRLDWPLHSFASVLWVGFVLFVWNMLVTYRQVKEWTLTAKCIYAAVMYLLATIMLGLFLSIHLAYPMVEMSHLTLLKLHAHAGIAGWLLMIVFGVSMKLLPMFLLSHNYGTKAGDIAFCLINVGLIGWSVAVALDSAAIWRQAGAGVLAAGIGFYLVQAAIIYRKRNKVRSDPHRRTRVRRIDFPLRFAVVAISFLGVSMAVGIGMAFFGDWIPDAFKNRAVVFYGAAIFLGFFSLLTQSLLYKIVPFLVWLKKFSHGVGRMKTPKIEDLVPRRSGIGQLLAYCAGTTLVLVGVAMENSGLGTAGAATICVSSGWLAGNLVAVWKRAVPLGPLVPAARCESRMASVSDSAVSAK